MGVRRQRPTASRLLLISRRMSTTPPAAWYPDPTGEHEHRYWDGRDWTEHVATRGEQAIAPVTSGLHPSNNSAGRAAGWYPDPLGRHDRRYWDGHGWTDHVAPPGQTTDAPTEPRKRSNNQIAQQMSQVGNTAPAGGGTLFTEPVLVVNQKVKKIGSGVGYRVYDQRGHQLGAIQEARRNLATRTSDNLRGRNHANRTYRFNVVDMEGRVLLGMTRPETWFTSKSTMVVEDSFGAPIGQITHETHRLVAGLAGVAQAGLGAAGALTGRALGGAKGVAASAAMGLAKQPVASHARARARFRQVVFGLESHGQRLGSVIGENSRTWEFRIHDASGIEIGRITKTWAGWTKESFTKSDNYVLQMHRPVTGPLQPLVIATALALDVALYQRDA